MDPRYEMWINDMVCVLGHLDTMGGCIYGILDAEAWTRCSGSGSSGGLVSQHGRTHIDLHMKAFFLTSIMGADGLITDGDGNREKPYLPCFTLQTL